MILIDTSIWIDHLRAAEGPLASLLESGRVWIHPWVVGELACGNLNNRSVLIDMLQALPRLVPATDDEVLFFIDRHRLMGRGIGYVDVHLLAAAAIHSVRILTRDQRLKMIAEEIGLDYTPGTH